MKHNSLATHYRPQTFSEVTGQDIITTVLSRATKDNNIAPAYLLSGTRGVGKTTIARILAKALNCANAPTTDPCNQCANCQTITQGNHIDVIEIDGASNNKVDDIRALRDTVGYSPMNGRYKIFIIDEAHMLTSQAFNALLKTLEEPPQHVVFIFATTEVHKFPITIVSRCQHFVFKPLSENKLVEHLSKILNKENITFDLHALHTIAKRASGSVRDSMSLLGQILSLDNKILTIENTNKILGLAGQEFFIALIQSILTQNYQQIIKLIQNISNQGLDIGFFLRELVNYWRTLFLLRESGKNILPSLLLSEDENSFFSSVANEFSLAHLHVAWHMTLDTQRKIIQNPDPIAALELLFINLTAIPRLLPLQKVDLSTQFNNDIQKEQEEVYTSSSILDSKQELQLCTSSTNNLNRKENTKSLDILKINQKQPDETVQHYDANSGENTNDKSFKENFQSANEFVSLEEKNINHTKLPSWKELSDYLQYEHENILPNIFFQQITGKFINKTLHIQTSSSTVYNALNNAKDSLQKILYDSYQYDKPINITQVKTVKVTNYNLIEEFNAHTELKNCREILGAFVYKVYPHK